MSWCISLKRHTMALGIVLAVIFKFSKVTTTVINSPCSYAVLLDMYMNMD